MQIKEQPKKRLFPRESIGEIEDEKLKISMLIPPNCLHFLFEDGTQYLVQLTSIAADVIMHHKEKE